MQNYVIKTKRLGLRFITENDVNYLKTVDNDPEVKKFFPEGTLNTLEILNFIEECQAKYKHNKLPCFVIFKLRGNEFIGEAYFDQLETGEIKVGYIFHKKHWHKGYATECLQALLDWAKGHIKTNYIVAYADVKNKASFRVMEKCGMEYYKDGYFLDMKSKFYRIKNA